jgi:hypothetical protein
MAWLSENFVGQQPATRTEMSPEKIKFEVARVVSQEKYGTT